MSRSTPWVLGCCGPMLMIMVSSSGTVESVVGRPRDRGPPRPRTGAAPRPTSRSRSTASVDVRGWSAPGRPRRSGGVGDESCSTGRRMTCRRWWSWLPRHGLAHRTVGAPLNCTGMRPDVVVLAERVAHPVLGHEDAGQVGVAGRRRCRTCRTPRAPWPRCRGGARTATGTVGSSPGTCTRSRMRSRSRCDMRVTTTSKRSGSMPRAAADRGGSGSRRRSRRGTSGSRRRAASRTSSTSCSRRGCRTVCPGDQLTGAPCSCSGSGRGSAAASGSAASLIARSVSVGADGRAPGAGQLGRASPVSSCWPSRCSMTSAGALVRARG